jgi:hypothetical protein
MSGNARVHVFDTYAKSKKGRIMHFDVILAEKDAEKALDCARAWLKGIAEEDAVVNPASCFYCHSTDSAPETLLEEIEKQGYAIQKLEGCPA